MGVAEKNLEGGEEILGEEETYPLAVHLIFS